MHIKTERTISARVAVIVAMAAILIFAAVISRFVQAAGETMSTVTDKTVYEQQTLVITDLQVNGTGNDELNMNLYVPTGQMQFGSTTGLTFDGDDYGSNLQFRGTRSAINAALATLQYQSDTPGTYTIEASLSGGEGDVYNPGNKHVYQVVYAGGEGINWDDARQAAEAMEYGGVSGYLATVTSQEEHDFISSRISQTGWIGANDSANEGVWRWVTGPEGDAPGGGMQFWNGTGATGSAVDGVFTNWSQSGEVKEPNDAGGNEDCAQIWFAEESDGQWNDGNCIATIPAYVVEFGAGEDLPLVASTDFEVTVNEAPEITFTQLTPADNSEVEAVDSISITFNQPMTMGEGAVTVYDASDDSELAELWDGTTSDNRTFIFELPQTLQPGKSYYVNISDSFFHGFVDYYHGFSSKTTWNFTVVDSDGISDEEENGAPNEGDGNNDGQPDANQLNVTSLIDPVTGEYAVLEVDEECAITYVDVAAAETGSDGSYQYPAGLMDFSLNCGTPGFTATIKQYYYGVNNEGFVVRKYNPMTEQYATISSATVAAQTINGAVVTTATYAVADGSELDLDGDENGEIVDPAGLAYLVAAGGTDTDTDASTGATAGTPNTGISPIGIAGFMAAGLAGIALLSVVGIYLYRSLRGRA